MDKEYWEDRLAFNIARVIATLFIVGIYTLQIFVIFKYFINLNLHNVLIVVFVYLLMIVYAGNKDKDEVTWENYKRWKKY